MKVTTYPIYIVHVEDADLTLPENVGDSLWRMWNQDGSIMYAFADEESAQQAKAELEEQINADD